ncbi:hypothetical protein BSPWISOXPB_4001 [uncultured Gammaproteobacteria bacterium]|nr:hypothetical protein BSPWISOXPB_4001 [uncultured Gammaproteobacteria bacterium]
MSDFRRKYAGLSFVGWHWGLLEKWINTKADNKQALQSAVTFFKNLTMTNLRKIQSFVKRSGRLTPAQEKGLTELWDDYAIEPQGC